MIKNYLKAAWRSLVREKINTIINIGGLTLGITGSLLLFIFIRDGSSFDNYHSNSDRIYRVVTKEKGNNGDSFTQGIPTVLPESFRSDFPEADEVAFTSYRRNSIIAITQASGQLKKYEEPKGVVFTEPAFFRIFDRAMIVGNADKGLDEPGEAIISKKWALKYFGRENVTGEIVRYEDSDYSVTGIMDDYPSNTDFPFELMLSYSTIKKSMDERGWGSISDSENCYFLLKNGESISSVENRMAPFAEKYLGKDDENRQGKEFLIQSLATIHSDMRFGNYNTRMPKQAMIAFMAIGVFLLVTCCVNFINLTTAASIKRTREVGIRKVLGSSRMQLISQLMGEVLIVTVLSVVFSLGLAQVMLEFLNPFLEISSTLQLATDFRVWIFLGSVTLVVTIISGLYPSLVASRYKPALALKNMAGTKISGHTMRKSLVVVQFFISQVFIICTIVIVRQHDFIREQNMGFAKDAIVTVPIPVSEGADHPGVSKMRTLKNEIMRIPGVELASLNNAPPSSRGIGRTGFSMPGSDETITTQMKQVDGDYIGLFQLELLSGKQLTDGDTLTGVVVNETLSKIAGFKSSDEIIGKEIDMWGSHLPVIGVLKDFNTTTLERAIEPVILFNNLGGYQSLSVKLNPINMQASIGAIQKQWEAAYPEYIFKYEFMDQQIESLYRGDRNTSTLFSLFSGIAIFIGCLGLFGLVTFMANQRTKEVGVRKVLGASVESIVLLFSKEFVKLIVIAFLLAAPLAGFVMHEVLQEFAYHIEIGPAIFISGLLITFLIAFLTVGAKSVKAALVNPVQSLRSE